MCRPGGSLFNLHDGATSAPLPAPGCEQADSALTTFWKRPAGSTAAQCRLKYCTSRSCFSAAARDLKVPRLRRLPVFGLVLREYSLYSPELSLRIMGFSTAILS